jgi:UDP-N-acetyl-D-mannosaminuronic acid transferase (WecB/TagA/CpsF family)
MIEDLTPQIIKLWKEERVLCNTDDLVALIHADSNKVRMDYRTAVAQRIKQHVYGADLLERVTRHPHHTNGTVKIWALIAFPEGQVCVLPFTVAYS